MSCPNVRAESSDRARLPVTCLLVEWYREELTDKAVDTVVSRLGAAAAAVSTAAEPIRLLATLSVPADDVLYCVFAAASPQAVLQVCTRAGMLPDRVVADVAAHIDQK